jgi:hypothetical protein
MSSSDQLAAYRYSADRIIQRLEEQLHARDEHDAREAALREKNPALKDAWDKYQMLLRMSE